MNSWNSTLPPPKKPFGRNPGSALKRGRFRRAARAVKGAAGQGCAAGSLTPAPPSEFTPKVKLLVRTRAGNGSAYDAMCEACGIGLGLRGGQVQHIIGRGMGGCRDELVNSAANAALLCGTPFDGCHGLATAFDAEIGARGFWLKRAADPRMVPMMLASEHGSGVLAWRTVEGGYLFEAPELEAAS